MATGLIKCLKGWGAGIVIMGFPVVCLNGSFYVGSEIWKILLSVFCVLFPALLLFHIVSRKPALRLKLFQLLVLTFLFVGSEIEFYMLPFNYTQVNYTASWQTNLVLALFTILAAFVVQIIFFPGKHLVIVQKEI